MGDGKKPKGVSVAVAVAVGRGVMLGKGVIVMDGVRVGINFVTVKTAVETAGLFALV